MIDPGVFKNEFAVLLERFGREDMSQVLTRRYYEHLSARLDTREFVRACRRLFADREFFPRPADFVEAVRPQAADALGQWELCQRVMEGDRTALAAMSPEGRRVVGLLGGPERLRMTRLTEVPWVEKRFLEHFAVLAEGAKADRGQLPAMTDKGRRLIEDAMEGRLDYTRRGETA